MLTVARWVLFALSTAALGATAHRVARRATDAGDLRLAATAALTAALAVAEALLLGLLGAGGDSLAVTGAAAGTWVVARLALRTRGVASTTLARDGWRRANGGLRAALGAAAAVTLVETAYVIARPLIGTDGLIYHLADPAIWLGDGRPGSMHPTLTALPVQAYPKSGEVLFTWTLATARTPVVTAPVMVAAAVLTTVCAWACLRRFGVAQWVAAVLALALLGSPVVVSQLAGPNTDLVTVAWVLATGLLCLGAVQQRAGEAAGVLAFAIVAAGLAVGTKTTGIPIAVGSLLVAVWVRRRELTSSPLALTLAGGLALGTGVVWYLRDLAVYGAPFYPFSRLPAGPALPAVVTRLGARFIDDPAGAIRVATPESFTRSMGGGLALAVGVVLAVLLLPAVRDRAQRRVVAIAAVAAVAEALIWSAAPFTGWSGAPGSRGLVLAGIRYLVPGFALFALVVGLASRVRGRTGGLARVVAVVALATDIWADRALGEGFRPHLATLVAAALAGAVLVGLAGVVRRPAPIAVPWLGGAALVAAIAALAAGTHGYLGRHLAVAERAHIGEPAVLAALAQQPDWAHGHEPVAIGPIADAMAAGPTFAHALSVITQTTPCAQVWAAAHHGWVILPQHATGYDRIGCLAGVSPRFTVGTTSVFNVSGVQTDYSAMSTRSTRPTSAFAVASAVAPPEARARSFHEPGRAVNR